ncbi:13939_t:CDS:2, partial [Gigaspora rosea]
FTMTKANYLSDDYYANYIFHLDNDFGLVLLFADLAVDTLTIFDESVNDSIYYCFNDYYVDSKNVNDSFEISGSDNEPNDSYLKEIYSGQTFTSFDILEKCLKHYSMQMGFETKI